MNKVQAWGRRAWAQFSGGASKAGQWAATEMFWRDAEASPGSNNRNTYAALTLGVTGMLALEVVYRLFDAADGAGWAVLAAGLVLTASAMIFFYATVIAIPFLLKEDETIDARRLFRDIMISTGVTIFSFAYLYRYLEIETDPPGDISSFDYVYFSAVTFSTLGYGDFSPTSGFARLAAAFEALIGNLHLGMLVGAVFNRIAVKIKG